MLRLIERWRSSGRTAVAFATEHGITRAKFEYWKRRLGVPGRKGRRLPGPGFVPVRLVGSAEPAATLEVVLARGDRLIIREAISAELLRAVIKMLREGC
jgi:hypothetical protein